MDGKIINLDEIDKIEQQIQVIRFVSQSLENIQSEDEFYIQGSQATLESVCDSLQLLVDDNKKRKK